MTDKDELREHDFDGIQEYDNDLPKWWTWLFWITIIFSVLYPFVYDFGPGQFPSETIDAEIASIKQAKEKAVGGTDISEESLLSLVKDKAIIARANESYALRCFACHATGGAGLIGPNLTDDYWLHGGKITDIRKVIADGVLEKGMPPWKDQLTPEQVNDLTALVWSLQGTNPPGAKEPQGELVERK